MELDFAGSSASNFNRRGFTKVVAPFKVADNPKPVAYINDLSVSESRGWNQLQIKLSKPATETFTIDYKFAGGDAINADYWWWSDQSGYRQVTFVKGQSTAVINVDVRDDSKAESNETFNIELSIASGSEGKVLLGSESVKVTIQDDDNSNTGINLESLSDKVLEAVKTTLVSELKTLTDANSATLSSTSTTFTNILLANESISDITTYLTNEVAEDITLYSPILKSVVSLVDEYVMAARGTKDIEASVKIDMAYQWQRILLQ